MYKWLALLMHYIFAKQRMKKVKPTYLITFSLVAIGLVYLYFFNPANADGTFFSCPLYATTGLQCPGCGSQRATHELLHLHFKEAFTLNPLFVLGLPLIIFGFYLEIVKPKSAFLLKVNNIFFSTPMLYILIAVVVLFTIIRNIFF